MSRLRRGLSVLVSAAAVLLVMTAVPARASTASHIYVESDQQLSDPYMLELDVNDFNGLQLTSLTVHVYAGTKDVYDIKDMIYTSGPAQQQFWTTAAPIPQAAVPPGTYTLTADATDADETDSGLKAYGLAILYTTTLTAVADPSALSYGETGTTISGTLTGVIAGSPYPNTRVPIAGAAITVADGPVTIPVGTTQADGSYSAHVQLRSAGSVYEAWAASGPTWQGGHASLATTVAKDATRLLSVTVTPPDFQYGGTVPATITGTAEYHDAVTGWQPLRDYPLEAGLNGAGGTRTVTTNGSGQFSWSFVPANETPWWMASGDGYILGFGHAAGPINIAVPLRFTSFTFSLSTLGQLTVAGCVQPVAAGYVPPTEPLQIQYSAGPSGPWTTLGHFARQRKQGCSVTGFKSYYTGSLPVRLTRAYYRAYLPATPDNQAAAIGPVLQWKYVTRIIALHASPSTVRRGGKLTVSGRLQADNGTWRNLAGQQVLIILTPKGSKTSWEMVRVPTTSSGYFTATFTDPASASWSAAYQGDTTHFASSSAAYYVPVSGPSASGTWGKAEIVPGTGGLHKGALVSAVSCASAGNCSSLGYRDSSGGSQVFAVAQVHGTWGTAEAVRDATATEAGFPLINSLSCASAGNCSAFGSLVEAVAGDPGEFVLSQVHGTWGKATEIPGSGAPIIDSVSCAPAGSCSAGGWLQTYQDRADIIVTSQVRGAWGKVQVVPGTVVLNTRGAGAINSVSCASSGNCSAGGHYTAGAYGQTQAFVVSQVHGTWGKAKEAPGTAALNKGGNATVNSLSCASPGNCVAGGYYKDSSGHQQVFVLSQVHGTWGKAEQAPGTAALNQGGDATVNSLSCTSPGNCSAGGNYKDRSGHQQAFVLSEVNGTWRNAQEIPGSAALNLGGNAALTALSCTSGGNCSAGGSYTDWFGHSQAFIVSQIRGTWGPAVQVPGTAAVNTGGKATITSLSCAPRGNCSAGGYYAGPFGNYQAFVISQT